MKLPFKLDLKKLPFKITLKGAFPIFAFLFSVILVLVLIVPTIQKIQRLQKDKDGVEAQLAVVEERSRQIRQLAASVSLLRSHNTVLTQAVPDEDNIPTLMNQVQQMAQVSGVTLSTLQFSGRSQADTVAEKGSGVGTVSLQVSVSGSYSQLQRFLETVEQASRVVDISSVNFGSDNGGVTLTIPLTAYYLPVAPVVDVSTATVTLNLNDPVFSDILTQVQALTFYDTPVDVGVGIGKSDPFSSNGSSRTPAPQQIETSGSTFPISR